MEQTTSSEVKSALAEENVKKTGEAEKAQPKSVLQETTIKKNEAEEEEAQPESEFQEATIKKNEAEEEEAQPECELQEATIKKNEAEEEEAQPESELQEATIKKNEAEEEEAQPESEFQEATIKKNEAEEEEAQPESELQGAIKKREKRNAQQKSWLEKSTDYFTWPTFVLVVPLLCIGLHWAFKGHEINHHELRLMLVGKTGAGKSASGNTILGEEVFRVEASPASVTASCRKKNKVLDRRNITIIDTPGVMDTWLISNQTAHHAHECISLSSPDPHVFLLVIRLGRFTVEESNAVKWIQENFGEEALKFTIILFTGGDLLEGKPVEKFISNSIDLQNLVDTCEGRYHVFNNYEQSNRTQVTELFEKINAMLHRNMGYFYIKEVHQKIKEREEKETQTVEEKNSAMMAKLIRDEELKRNQLKEEMKVAERRKMNEMAIKLRDEQYENKHLMAELELTYITLFWFKVTIGLLLLILLKVVCFPK